MSRPNVKREREVQATKIQAAYDYLRARLGEWVPALEIARAINSMAVSTKLSQARELAAKDDAEIIWNENPRESCYMLRPKSLGPSAETERSSQRTLPGLGISSLHR